jgi:hypothetical protein
MRENGVFSGKKVVCFATSCHAIQNEIRIMNLYDSMVSYKMLYLNQQFYRCGIDNLFDIIINSHFPTHHHHRHHH